MQALLCYIPFPPWAALKAGLRNGLCSFRRQKLKKFLKFCNFKFLKLQLTLKTAPRALNNEGDFGGMFP
jgi:hypothetical protein